MKLGLESKRLSSYCWTKTRQKVQEWWLDWKTKDLPATVGRGYNKGSRNGGRTGKEKKTFQQIQQVSEMLKKHKRSRATHCIVWVNNQVYWSCWSQRWWHTPTSSVLLQELDCINERLSQPVGMMSVVPAASEEQKIYLNSLERLNYGKPINPVAPPVEMRVTTKSSPTATISSLVVGSQSARVVTTGHTIFHLVHTDLTLLISISLILKNHVVQMHVSSEVFCGATAGGPECLLQR